jgi:hypothetical protein
MHRLPLLLLAALSALVLAIYPRRDAVGLAGRWLKLHFRLFGKKDSLADLDYRLFALAQQKAREL